LNAAFALVAYMENVCSCVASRHYYRVSESIKVEASLLSGWKSRYSDLPLQTNFT